MRKKIRVSALKYVILLFLLLGCQSIKSDDGSTVTDSSQSQSLTLIGVSPELHAEAVKQGEKAKSELKTLKKDRSLSATAKRILAEAEEAEEQGNNELYLAKIQEYRRLLNDEPIKRAAESWILEGQVLFSQLRLKEAQNAVEEAVKLDSNNPEYLLTLAEYLRWNGEYRRMEEVSLEAISLIKSQDSLDELLLTEGLTNLGGAYLFEGNYDSAIAHLQQALEMRQRLLGESHPDVAESLNNLALLYYSQGRYDRAEPLYLQALEMTKKLLGESHPYVALSLNNLALLYYSQGRYDRAEPLYLQALEMTKKLLGESHPDVASSLNNLALLYESQGRYDEAETLFLQALEMTRKLLGESHPHTKTVYENLLDLRKNLKQLEK